MFGQNKIEKKRLDDGGQTLEVKEIFGTLQGEGPYAGRSAIFIRLAGCNLACTFCDTAFENGEVQTLLDIDQRVQHLCEQGDLATTLVVLTGGEPLRQNCEPLIEMLLKDGFDVQIETAGTLWQDDLDRWMRPNKWGTELTIVCSPKTPQVHKKIEQYCEHYKYIVSVGDFGLEDGLPVRPTQAGSEAKRLYRATFSHATVWVQPKAEYTPYADHIFRRNNNLPIFEDDVERNKANAQHAARIAMKYDYRLSLQTHKILNLP